MIIIVFGLPGTGKTYFADTLAVLMDATLLSTDSERDYMNLVSGNKSNVNYLVYEQLLKEMAAQIQYKKKVIVDGTFHKEKVRNLFLEKARELRQDVFFVEIKADDRIVHDRLKKRPGFIDADYKVYLQLKSEYEPVYHPHLVLWSDDHNVDEMVEKANVYIFGRELLAESNQMES